MITVTLHFSLFSHMVILFSLPLLAQGDGENECGWTGQANRVQILFLDHQSRFVRVIPSTPTAQTRITGRPAGVYKSPGDAAREVFSFLFRLLQFSTFAVRTSSQVQVWKCLTCRKRACCENLVHITADIRRCRNSSLQKKRYKNDDLVRGDLHMGVNAVERLTARFDLDGKIAPCYLLHLVLVSLDERSNYLF